MIALLNPFCLVNPEVLQQNMFRHSWKHNLHWSPSLNEFCTRKWYWMPWSVKLLQHCIESLNVLINFKNLKLILTWSISTQHDLLKYSTTAQLYSGMVIATHTVKKTLGPHSYGWRPSQGSVLLLLLLLLLHNELIVVARIIFRGKQTRKFPSASQLWIALRSSYISIELHFSLPYSAFACFKYL